MGEIYEGVLVPSIFRPWAEILVQRATLQPGESVLDVACGTGIVARLARGKVGSSARAVGIDISPMMLGVARTLAPDIDWREGNAIALPLGDAEKFEAVFCHQGLQFAPDRPAAARELRRATAQRGRAVAGVWGTDEGHVFLSGLRRVAERHVGALHDTRHSFADPDSLRSLLASAGFSDVTVETFTRTVHFNDGSAFVRLNAMALVNMSARGKEYSDNERAALVDNIVRDSAELMRAHSDSAGLHYEISSNVATARP
jgi:SAM-dependent methyltransferase